MSTIADKIETLYGIKSDIKNAIIAKGVEVNDDFTTYADDIDQISGGSAYPLEGVPVYEGMSDYINRLGIASNTSFYEKFYNVRTAQFYWKVRLTSSSGSFERMFYYDKSNPFAKSIYLDIVGDYMVSAYYMCRGQKLLVASQINYDWFTNTGFMYTDCTALKFVCTDEVKATNCQSMFWGCTNLLEAPTSFPNATQCDNVFYGCTSLTNLSLSMPKATNVLNICNGCTSLETLSLDLGTTRDSSLLINIGQIVWGCTKIKAVDIIMNTVCDRNFNGINIGNNGSMFYNCSKLVRVTGLNLAYQAKMDSNLYILQSSNPVRYFVAYNIGYGGGNNNYTTWDFATYIPLWGIEDVNEPYSIGAAQSLKDSLITYSYDRTQFTRSTRNTLTLTTAQKALLTDEEKAQITAKGYTIA